MHAQNIRAAQHAGGDAGGGSLQPFFDRQIQNMSDEGFAGYAHKKRESQRLDASQMGDQGQIVLRRFAETYARIQNNFF